jgi:hypothetical protein
MKKLFTTLLLTLSVATFAFSQKVVSFTTTTSGDTAWVSENNIVLLTKTNVGSTLMYYKGTGDIAYLAVLERAVDTAAVASTGLLNLSGWASGDTIDSIKVNGVKVFGAYRIPFTSNAATSIGRLEDSIDVFTSTPNYSATNTDTTLTLVSPTASAESFNGYVVEVFATGITFTGTTMAGGFNVRRNVLTLTDKLFNVEGGDRTLNVQLVKTLNASTGACQIFYNNGIMPTITVSDWCSEVQTAIDGL